MNHGSFGWPRCSKDAGFSTVGEAWELRARGGFVVDLDAAFERAERVLALVSRDYVRETFCVPKWRKRLEADPDWARRTLVAVSVDPTWDYERFEGASCIHLFDHDEESARQQVLGRLRRQLGADLVSRPGPGRPRRESRAPWPRAVGALTNLTAPPRPPIS
jgi:hypothetical protein